MTETGVHLQYDGPIATVTLCRPAVLNAQTPATWAALRDIGRELPGDIRMVLFRGEGRAFSAGLDRTLLAEPESFLQPLLAGSDADTAARIESFQQGFSWLRRPDLISIAAVHGHAVGAGFQLALHCDLRVLSTDAVLSMAEITLGLVPDLGGTKRLVELVGYARAFELCATGRQIPAAEAQQMGLAALVVPPAELDEAVADLAGALLAADRDAVTELKALLLGAADRAYPAQDRAEREAQTRLLRGRAGLSD